MSDFYDLMRDITNELIEEESIGIPSNIMQIVRENFELWEFKLFPLLKRQNKSCYGSLVKIFHSPKIGLSKVTEDQLRVCFQRVKNEKSAKGLYVQKGVSHVVPGANAIATEAVQGLPPANQVQRHTVVTTPVGISKSVGVSQGGGRDPRVYGRQGGVSPCDSWTDINDEIDRLKNEREIGWGDWTGIDEDLWHSLLDAIAKYDSYNTVKFNAEGSHPSFYKDLSETKRKLFEVLYKKALAVRK